MPAEGLEGPGGWYPGIEIRLINGSQHLAYFQDDHDRQRFTREMETLMPAVMMWRMID